MGSLQFKMFSTYFSVVLFLLVVDGTSHFYEMITRRNPFYHIICLDFPTVNVAGSGMILSPGFYSSRKYPPNMNCKVHLRIRRNRKINISFRFLKLEKSPQCSHDRITIYRQTSEGLSKIKHFCGSDKPADLIVEGPNIIVQFVSNHINQFDGFVMYYIEEPSETDQSCSKPEIVNVIKSGTITSPGFEEGRYPPNKKCEYILRIPANKILIITFSTFSLEKSKGCFDSLTIYRKTSSLHQIGKWCRNIKPKDIFVKGPEILIRFNSDGEIEERGFRLHYIVMDKDSPGCGTRPVAFQSNIFRGNMVKSTEKWPWMVSVNEYSRLICAGTILNEYWILTAAHCLSYQGRLRSHITIQAGDSKLSRATHFKTSKLILHPKYNFPRDDIALIRLQTPLKMSDTIRPICFKDYDVKSTQNCYVTGWGYLGKDPPVADDLHEAKVDIWDEDLCRDRLGYVYTDAMICARGRNNENTCKGDSGGPLMCSDQSGLRWSIVGVTSFGFGCYKQRDIPTYTKVSAFIYWIQKTMSDFQEN